MSALEIKKLLDGFRRKKILIVGDVILDLYIYGSAERLSPEAPVPVLLEKSRKYILGGAGNVAANIASLGGKAVLAGVIGRDSEGNIIKKLCRKSGIECRLVSGKGRPTTVKTRPIAEQHQLLRLDRETIKPISRQTEKKIAAGLRKVKNCDLVAVSDYSKGCLNQRLMGFLKKKFGKEKIIAGVKPQQEKIYRNLGLIILNLKEARALTGIFAESDSQAAKLTRRLSQRFSSSVVLTRGSQGMTGFDKKRKEIFHIPARALSVYDVTGAGDTVLAVSALMLSGGAALKTSLAVANAAAGIVVGIEGTAVVSSRALKEALLGNV